MSYIQYKPSSSTYETVRDILVSRNFVPGTYTLDARTVAADSDGDKKVREGTVLATYAFGGSRVKPHVTGEVAIAVLLNPVNLRYDDVAETVVLQGWVDENVCSDDGTYGSVLAQTKVDLANRIYFVNEKI